MKNNDRCMVKVKIDTLIKIYERYLGDFERHAGYAKEVKLFKKEANLTNDANRIRTILEKLKFFKEDTNVLFLPANRYYKLCKVAVDFYIFED